MVSSNKILTVSYGTFSCTLEGFDNSFDTMKAIAEYFRDLAQDDRYFGAEPPTPDAEMLARIAEREIERRVEARFEKGNLVLRPTDETELPRGDVAPDHSSGAALAGAAAAVAASTLSEPASAEEHEADEAPVMEVDVTPDVDVPALEDTPEDEEEFSLDLSDLDLTGDTSEEEVEYVSEIVAEESGSELEALEDDAHADEDALSEIVGDSELDESEDDVSIEDLIASQETDTDPVAEDIGTPEGLADATPVDAPDDSLESDFIEEVAEAVAEPVAEVEEVTDSVADKLQRIRAVVASKAQEEPEYIEDEHAMSGPDGDGIDLNDAIDGDAQIPGFDDDALDAEENLFADTIAAIVDDETGHDADIEDASDADSELEALRARIAELEAQTIAASEPADVEQDASDVEDTVEAASDEAPETVLELTDDDRAEDAPEPIVARVAKAKRADVEAALAAGDLEEYDEDEGDVAIVEDAEATSDPQPATGADDSTLTPEQEAELARELADLQAEIDEDDDWDFDISDEKAQSDVDEEPAVSAESEEDAEANIRKAVKMTSPARAMLTDKDIEEDEASVDRLIGQTETEMDEPEGNRRRSAIAHLRAAVAATKAERLLGLGKKKVDEEEPYREDLADAVRPRRPQVTQSRSERPAPVRTAPLKLVAEQRVDTDSGEEAATPVRPRRVMRADPVDTAEDVAGSDTGFAEFAESQGAHSLQDLLEAAAAYMSFVEGRDQFSRPQLMTKLHQAEGTTSSREERLRSFGQLLRDGKIEKKGGGRFAASDSIGFKPDTRAAG